MKIPPASPPPRPASSHPGLAAAAALAVLIAASATSAAAIGEPSAQIDVHLARVEAHRAVVAFIALRSTDGIPMEGDIHVFSRGEEVALIPVFSMGALSLSIPVAPDTAQHVTVCVRIDGEFLYAGDAAQAFEASDCDVLDAVLAPPRIPQPPALIPQPRDVSYLDRTGLR